MLDLYNNKYDRTTLKENIYSLKLMDILKTQVLEITFIVRYILNKLYQLHDDDQYIKVDTVIEYQPHINKKELICALIDYNSDDDSVEDFQSYSERNK